MRASLLLLVVAACDPTLDPTPPAALPWDVLAISATRDHTLAVTSAGAVESDGVAISLPADPSCASDCGAPLPTLPVVLDVAVGDKHACALSSGTAYCWGDHTDGALGASRACSVDPESGVTSCLLDAQPVVGMPALHELAAGRDVTCGLAVDDRVFCWGAPGAWLGGSVVPVNDPATPVLADGAPLLATRIVIHDRTVCAIDHAGTAWCWGDAFTAHPTRWREHVVDIALGGNHSCAIAEDGLTCWGDNRNGQAGDLDAARTCGDACDVGPTAIGLPAIRVVVGERHTCALTEGGDVWCWGSNEVGQLGRDDAFLVGGLGLTLQGDVVDLVAGDAHTCALTAHGAAWCWGEHLATY